MALIAPFSAPGRFWRGNLHTHSNLSDGALEPRAVVDAYKHAGYDFMQLSEHFIGNFDFPIADTRSFRSNSFTTLIGAELHAPETAVGELWHIVAAGLPLDLPDMARDFPNTALIPILSDARGVQLVVRKWEKRGRLPDAVVIEHPRLAGGHLGAAKVADLQDRRFDFDVAIPQVLEFFKSAGLEGKIPLIAAGGVSTREDILRLQGLGASAAQLGTAFAVTHECDAADGFKRVLANAQAKDIVEFMSVSGLPARAVRTPWLNKYLRIVPKLQAAAHQKKKCNMSFDCLAHCGLRDGDAAIGQFCIDQQLGHAFEGDAQKGLFFRGAGVLPFGKQIRSVAELMQWLLGAIEPQPFEREFV